LHIMKDAAHLLVLILEDCEYEKPTRDIMDSTLAMLCHTEYTTEDPAVAGLAPLLAHIRSLVNSYALSDGVYAFTRKPFEGEFTYHANFTIGVEGARARYRTSVDVVHLHLKHKQNTWIAIAIFRTTPGMTTWNQDDAEKVELCLTTYNVRVLAGSFGKLTNTLNRFLRRINAQHGQALAQQFFVADPNTYKARSRSGGEVLGTFPMFVFIRGPYNMFKLNTEVSAVGAKGRQQRRNKGESIGVASFGDLYTVGHMELQDAGMTAVLGPQHTETEAVALRLAMGALKSDFDSWSCVKAQMRKPDDVPSWSPMWDWWDYWDAYYHEKNLGSIKFSQLLDRMRLCSLSCDVQSSQLDKFTDDQKREINGCLNSWNHQLPGVVQMMLVFGTARPGKGSQQRKFRK